MSDSWFPEYSSSSVDGIDGVEYDRPGSDAVLVDDHVDSAVAEDHGY